MKTFILHYFTFLLILLFFNLNQITQCYTTSDPTWLASPYFKSSNKQVISSLTGSGSTPSYTFTFSSAFTGIPNLVYSIKNYRANDKLSNEKFQIKKVSLSASTLKVSVQIFQTTQLILVNVAYLAIDPTFPHHLNTFDNVPVNISNGNLVNISTQSGSTTIYTNQIDYSVQSASNTYSTFQTPLTSNKIVLFISTLFMQSKNNPLNLTIASTIVNTTYYKLTVTVSTNLAIQKLHFSQLVYNQDDVASSGTYSIVYEQWTVSAVGGYKQFPIELIGNMIMGIKDFSTSATACGFQYNWYFVTNQGGFTHAIRVNDSTPSKGFTGLDNMKSTLFYIQQWMCASPYDYYNQTALNCQDQCAVYYVQNTTDKTCQPCHYACIECSAPNDSTACLQCQAGKYRTLVNGSCECDAGYFDDGYSIQCVACGLSVSNCATCSYPLNSSLSESDYQTIFASGTWPDDISVQFTCFTCDSPYFINTTSDQCQSCTLTYCLTCSSLTQCSVCNSSTPSTLHTDNLCYLCSISNCTSCNSTNICTACQPTFTLINNTCLTCSQSCTCDGYVSPIVNGSCSSQCGDGYTVLSQACDDNNTVSHDGCGSTCLIQTCSENCSCDGWVFPVLANDSCSTLCGDGYLRGDEQCDDNNTVEHDGCGSSCLIQTCSENCSCDGWTMPWITSDNMCTTVCGDGYVRGNQQCQQSISGLSQCDALCAFIISQSGTDVDVFVTAQQSYLMGLVVFIMGFRVIGMQMLFVFQNFQLVLSSYTIEQFKLSENFHGYSDVSAYPFDVTNNSNKDGLQENYNFMLILVLGLFGLSVFLKALGQCFNNNDRNNITNQNTNNNSKNNNGDEDESPTKNDKNHRKSIEQQQQQQQLQKSQSQPTQQQSQQDQQFAVHYDRKIQSTQTTAINSKKSRFTQESFYKQFTVDLSSKLTKFGGVLLNQVFYDLLVNCLCVFFYYLSKEIIEQGVSQLMGFAQIITIASTVLLLVGIMCLCSFENELFGENQLKFKYQKWMQYWAIVIAERIVYSIILSFQYQYSIFVIIFLKFIVIVTFIFTGNYFERIQKKRSLIIQTLHLLLLVSFSCNQQYFKNQGILSQFFMEILYTTILGIILIITLGFYMREVLFYCSADFRYDNAINSQQSEQISKISNYRNAVFDVQSQHFQEYSAESLKKSINQDFQNEQKQLQNSDSFLAIPIKAPPSTSKNITNNKKDKFKIHKRKNAQNNFKISKNPIIFNDLNIDNKNESFLVVQEQNNKDNKQTPNNYEQKQRKNIFDQPSIIFDQQLNVAENKVNPRLSVQKSTKVNPIKRKKYMKSTKRVLNKIFLNNQNNQIVKTESDYDNQGNSQIDLYKKKKKKNMFGEDMGNTLNKNKTSLKQEKNNLNLMTMSVREKNNSLPNSNGNNENEDQYGYDAISINFD